jgi:hypothetical protein
MSVASKSSLQYFIYRINGVAINFQGDVAETISDFFEQSHVCKPVKKSTLTNLEVGTIFIHVLRDATLPLLCSTKHICSHCK